MANSKMKTCKHCGAEIAKSAKVCPNCGGRNKKPIFLRWWFIALIILVVLIAIGGGSKSSGTQQVGTVGQPSAGTAQTGAKSTEPTPEPKTVFNVGDILQDGATQIVYVASGEYNEKNEFMQPGDGHKYIFLTFAFINTGKSDTAVSFYSFEAYADGYNVDMYYGGEDDLSATLSAGRSTMGQIYFEVPEDAKEIEVEYTPNVFSDRKIKFVYEGDQDSGFVLQPNTTRTEGAVNPGETVETKTLRIAYLSCEDYDSDNMFVQPKPGCRYITLFFEFENLSSSDELVSSYSFDCYADGIACDATFIREDDLQATISAGRKAKGTVTFEVPDAAEVVEAEFNSNVWTSNRIAFTVR